MTKAIKKTLLAILAFGLVVAGAFSAMSFRSASADYTIDNFIADAQAYAVLVDTDGTPGLSDEEILAAMGSTDMDEYGKTADAYFFGMYNYINNDSGSASGDDYENSKLIFNRIFAQYNRELINVSGQPFGVVDLYSNLVTTVRDIYSQIDHNYTRDKDSAVIYRNLFDYIVNNTVEANPETEDDTTGCLAFLMNSDLEWVNAYGYKSVVEKVTPYDLYKAENKIDTWYNNIVDAIAAIKNIQIYIEDEAANATVNVWNDEDNLYKIVYVVGGTEQEPVIINNVVLASEQSINTASNKVATVTAQGDIGCLNGSYPFDDTYTNHKAILDSAKAGLAAQKAKVTAVETEINNVYADYSEEEGAEVCYTIRDAINAAKESYEALDGADYNNDETDDNLNNLKAAVNEEVLNKGLAMLNTLANVTAKIAGVKGKIDAIGAIYYTKDTKDLIDAARAAFDALPNDVKTFDNANYNEDGKKIDSDYEYCVENYDDLIIAEVRFAEYVAEVKALINEIKSLRIIEIDNALTIYSKANSVQILYNTLSDKNNQLTGDNGNLLSVRNEPLSDYEAAKYWGREDYEEGMIGFYPSDAVDPNLTTGNAYDYYVGLMNRITTSVKNIKIDIETLKGLGDVRLTVAFDNLYNQIKTAINALPKVGGELDERYEGAISNYNDYVALATKYEELLALAKTWAAAVNEIGTVSVNTFDKVDAAIEAYEALKAEYTVNYNLGNDLAQFEIAKTANGTDYYSLDFVTYTNACNLKDQIIDKLDEVKDLIDELVRPELLGTEKEDTDPVEYFTVGDYNLYADAVATITEKYNKLSDFDDVSVEEYVTTKVYFETYAGDDDATAEDYVYSFAKYVKALIYVAADDVEIAIDKIFTSAADEENYIKDARVAYDAATDAVKAEVRNYTDEDATEVDTLTEVEAKLQAWQDNVFALLNGAAFDGSDVTDIGIVANVTNDTELKASIYKLDLDAVEDYYEEYADFTAVEKAYVYTVDETEYNIPEAKLLLDTLDQLAGGKHNDLGKKLTYIDAELAEYVHDYNIGHPTDGRYEELKEIVENLHVTQQQILNNLDDFQQIERDNEMAIALAKAIVELYNDIDAGVTEEAVVEYYIIQSIYDGLNESQKVLVNANVRILDDEADLADIEEAVEDAIENGTFVDVDQNVITAIDNALDDALAENGDITAAYKAYFDGVIANYYNKGQVYTKDEVDGKISTAINTAKGEIETAYNTAINDAIATAKQQVIDAAADKDDALKTAIETAYNTAINNAIATAKGQIETAYNTAIADAVNAAKTEINTAIATAKQKAIDDAKAYADGKDEALEAAIEEAYEAAIETAIDDVKELFNGKIVELTNKYQELLNRINENQGINETAVGDINKKIAELEEQLSSAKSSATVAMVISIISVVAAAAAIVMIFIFKRR